MQFLKVWIIVLNWTVTFVFMSSKTVTKLKLSIQFHFLYRIAFGAKIINTIYNLTHIYNGAIFRIDVFV